MSPAMDHLPSSLSTFVAKDQGCFSNDSDATTYPEGTQYLFTLRKRVHSDSFTSMEDQNQVPECTSAATKTFPLSIILDALNQFEFQFPVVVDWIRLLYTLSTSTILIITFAFVVLFLYV